MSACSRPNQEVLIAFRRGMLPEADIPPVSEHVKRCPTCRTALESIGDETERVVSNVQCASTAGEPKPEPLTSDPGQTLLLGSGLATSGHPAEPPPATQEESPTSGQLTTIGRYTITGTLGTGGFGNVYRAYDPDLRRDVAIKMLRRDRLESPQAVQQFLQEAQSAARLRHSGLVAIHDVGHQPDGSCYVVMEYVEGSSLQQLLASKRLSIDRVVGLLTEVSEAVHYAHTQGLIHRDLKPANILVDSKGHAHVADFGLAVHEERQRQHAGQVAGTPVYMAPEQVLGHSHRLDGRTDIHSLGVILYEAFTGRRPFRGATAEELFDEILHREPKPLRQIDDQIPDVLEQVTLKCLAKRVADRYTTAADLAAALRHWSEMTRSPQPASSGRTIRASAAMKGRGCAISLEILMLLLAIAMPTGVVGVKYGWPRVKEYFSSGMMELEEGAAEGGSHYPLRPHPNPSHLSKDEPIWHSPLAIFATVVVLICIVVASWVFLQKRWVGRKPARSSLNRDRG
jgi:serine/threonine protein kinase